MLLFWTSIITLYLNETKPSYDRNLKICLYNLDIKILVQLTFSKSDVSSLIWIIRLQGALVDYK